MKKFKNKATGVIYTVTADAIIAQFERDSRYVEVKVKETSADASDKKGKKGAKVTAPAESNENAPADDETSADASDNDDETNEENK